MSQVDSLTLTFLGTSAGKPSTSRNVSSLSLRLDKDIWVFDAGEATQHQFMKSSLKMGSIRKMFITHMHGDHVFGIVPLLCTIDSNDNTTDNARPTVQGGNVENQVPPQQMPIEIFGPAGLRQMIRGILNLTYCHLARPYVVHELLFESDSPERSDNLHSSERKGQNIMQSGGFWRNFAISNGMEISAGPILHTIPCLGYVVEEQPRRLPIDPSLYVPHLTRNTAALALIGIKNPISLLSKITRDRESITLPDGTILEPPAMGGKGRKVVILGDTYDATRMSELCLDADVLIHEATNAFMPTLDPAQAPADPTAVVKKGEPDKTQASVRQTAKAHGHSTPEVAGEFAKLVRAKSLILNHISNKYCQPVLEGEVGYEEEDLKRKMIEEIVRLATVAWGSEGSNAAIVARDFMEIKILRSKS